MAMAAACACAAPMTELNQEGRGQARQGGEGGMEDEMVVEAGRGVTDGQSQRGEGQTGPVRGWRSETPDPGSGTGGWVDAGGR